jgi:hypothetical protein
MARSGNRKTGRKQSGSVSVVRGYRQRSLLPAAEVRRLTLSWTALRIARGATADSLQSDRLDHPVPTVLDGREATGTDKLEDAGAADV